MIEVSLEISAEQQIGTPLSMSIKVSKLLLYYNHFVIFRKKCTSCFVQKLITNNSLPISPFLTKQYGIQKSKFPISLLTNYKS